MLVGFFLLALKFYLSLLVYCKDGENSEDAQFWRNMLKPYQESDPLYWETMNVLIDDCVSDTTDGRPGINKPSKDMLEHYVSIYTNAGNSFNLYDDKLISNNPYIGFYSDMWLFKVMNDFLK